MSGVKVSSPGTGRDSAVSMAFFYLYALQKPDQEVHSKITVLVSPARGDLGVRASGSPAAALGSLNTTVQICRESHRRREDASPEEHDGKTRRCVPTHRWRD
jgi:hypothetical protein